jgi:hypothetical protein
MSATLLRKIIPLPKHRTTLLRKSLHLANWNLSV